ncbi:MAG: ATP-binding protein [Dehalococcoidia bacterium]
MTTLISPRSETARVEPVTLSGLGVSPAVVRDLLLKTMFYRGRLTRTELSDELRVALAPIEELLQAMSREGLASVLTSDTPNAASYGYTLTQQGHRRAEEALARNGYIGPVPVAVSDYVAQVRAQSIADIDIPRDELERGLGALVLNDDTLRRIGWAVRSHKPMLIHGESGNGKTTVAHKIGNVVGGTVLVPYAVEVVGQIVRVFDASKHEPVADEDDGDDIDRLMRPRLDGRWARVKRPVIWAGGELTRHSLELVLDSDTKLYEAPLQLKANGGTLIIDDLGRQQIPAVQLLNRWIVALESGSDHLTLHTGQTVEIPFDSLLVFSTNLPPESLADEAFLRRIRYKVEIPGPDETEYREIFRRECAARGIAYDDASVTHLFATWYGDRREMRGSHPRDVVEAVVDAARHDDRAPEITPAALDDACKSYFLA